MGGNEVCFATTKCTSGEKPLSVSRGWFVPLWGMHTPYMNEYNSL